MIIYTQKIDHALLMAAALGSIRYRGRSLPLAEITAEILEELKKEHAQFGFYQTKMLINARSETALFVWGDSVLRSKRIDELTEEDCFRGEDGRLLPKDLIFVPAEGKEDAAAVLRTLLANEDHAYVVNACLGEDALYDFLKVYEFANLGKRNTPVFRCEMQEMSQDAIRSAFSNLQKEHTVSELIAEKTRRYVFWICNIGLGRILRENIEKSRPLPFRFLPLLFLIVKRSYAQEEKKQISRYRIATQADFQGKTFSLSDSSLEFEEKEDAVSFLKTLPGEAVVTEILQEEELDYAKGPFSLKALIEKAATHPYAGFSAEKTIQIRNALFEKGLITNIDAKSRKYRSEQRDEIRDLLSMLGAVGAFRSMLQGIDLFEMPHEYFSPKADGGIVVTKKRPVQKDMTEEESFLYALIAKEMIKTAYPPRRIQKRTCIVETGDAKLCAEEKTVLSAGYTLLEKRRAERAARLPAGLQKGSRLTLSFAPETVKEGPLPLFSERDLIRKFAGKDLYSASDVVYGLNLLLQREFLLKKQQKLLPTESGKDACLFFSEEEPLLSGAVLAKWENDIRKIREAADSEAALFAQSLLDSVRKYLRELQRKYEKESLGREIPLSCPVCQKSLYRTDQGFFCSACRWKIDRLLFGRGFTDRQLCYLVQNRQTPIIAGFTNGNRFVHGRVLLDAKNRAVFTEDSKYSCPRCGRKLRVAADGTKYACPDCHFEVKFSYFGCDLSNEQLQMLLTERITPEITDFRDEKGSFSGRLYIDPGKDYAVRLAVSHSGE